jgi:hypothetical protein
MSWRANVIVCGGEFCFEIKLIRMPHIGFIGWSAPDAMSWCESYSVNELD